MKPGADYPNSQAVYTIKKNKEEIGEWRCGGGGKGAYSVIFGRHPKGMDYSIEQEVPARELSEFGSIWWRDWELPWKRQTEVASEDGPFIPKSDWQKGPDGVVPIGGDYKFKISSEGKKWMRWNPPVPGPEIVFDTRTQNFQEPPTGAPEGTPGVFSGAEEATHDTPLVSQKRARTRGRRQLTTVVALNMNRPLALTIRT